MTPPFFPNAHKVRALIAGAAVAIAVPLLQLLAEFTPSQIGGRWAALVPMTLRENVANIPWWLSIGLPLTCLFGYAFWPNLRDYRIAAVPRMTTGAPTIASLQAVVLEDHTTYGVYVLSEQERANGVSQPNLLEVDLCVFITNPLNADLIAVKAELLLDGQARRASVSRWANQVVTDTPPLIFLAGSTARFLFQAYIPPRERGEPIDTRLRLTDRSGLVVEVASAAVADMWAA